MFLSGCNCLGIPVAVVTRVIFGACVFVTVWAMSAGLRKACVGRPTGLPAFIYLGRVLACACCKQAVLEALRIDNV